MQDVLLTECHLLIGVSTRRYLFTDRLMCSVDAQAVLGRPVQVHTGAHEVPAVGNVVENVVLFGQRIESLCGCNG